MSDPIRDEITDNIEAVKPRLRNRIFAALMPWLLASLCAAALSSAASSHSNLSSLRGLGIDIPFGTFTAQVFADLKGIGPLLFIFISLGMAVALPVAGQIYKRVNRLRSLVYSLAGMGCLLVMFLMMELAFFGTPIIQGARTIGGLSMQMLCGGVGGGVYAALTRAK